MSKPPVLLGVPEIKVPEQPAFPTTAVAVSPQGVKFTLLLAPGIELSTMLNEETMNQICGLWLQTRQSVQDQIALTQKIKQSKTS